MEIILVMFAGLLMAIIFMLLWYIKRLWNIIEDTKNGINDMKEAIQLFSQHLQTLYKQDVFYGEPTVERLIKHSKMLVQEIDAFITLFLVSDSNQMELKEDEKKETNQN